MSRTTEDARRYRVAVAERIREARESRGVTQKQIEAKTGIPQSTLSAIEKGERQGATTEQVALIAAALGVPTDDLLPRPQPMEVTAPSVDSAKQPGMSAWQRKLQSSKEGFLARHAAELGQLDVEHVNEVTFLSKPVDFPDDEYWFDVVESGRRRRERARRRGDGGKTPA